MPDDPSSKYNPYNPFTEEWEKYEKAQRNKEYAEYVDNPLTPRQPVTPSYPQEVPSLPGFPNSGVIGGDSIPLQSTQFHTMGAERYPKDTNAYNGYYGQKMWDKSFADIAKMMRQEAGKTKEDVPEYLVNIYNNMKKAYAAQKAQGEWRFGNERRPDEGVSGNAGDVKYSGVTSAQAQRLQNQVTRQDTMNAPAQVARQSMFDALQARVNKQLELQGIQSEQSRDLALKKMIYEKQAGELKLEQMKDQIDTQYMNSLISTIGNTFANAYTAWNQRNTMRQYGSDYAKDALQNSLPGFANTWNTNYMPWE